MNLKRKCLLCVAVLLLSGCATMPTGPSVMVLPAPGKSFEGFQSDDIACRQWAEAQTGRSAEDTFNQNLAGGAVAGTLIGAGLGAAIGAASGNAATGAAIGAASGLIGGTAVASGPAYSAGWEAQRRYDNAYQQCMYAKGNQIQGQPQASQRTYSVPPPPPPPGYAAGPPMTTAPGPYPPPPPR